MHLPFLLLSIGLAMPAIAASPGCWVSTSACGKIDIMEKIGERAFHGRG